MREGRSQSFPPSTCGMEPAQFCSSVNRVEMHAGGLCHMQESVYHSVHRICSVLSRAWMVWSSLVVVREEYVALFCFVWQCVKLRSLHLLLLEPCLAPRSLHVIACRRGGGCVWCGLQVSHEGRRRSLLKMIGLAAISAWVLKFPSYFLDVGVSCMLFRSL